MCVIIDGRDRAHSSMLDFAQHSLRVSGRQCMRVRVSTYLLYIAIDVNVVTITTSIAILTSTHECTRVHARLH